jgi:hypothetical protein
MACRTPALIVLIAFTLAACASPVTGASIAPEATPAASVGGAPARVPSRDAEAILYRTGRYVLLNQGYVDARTGAPIVPDGPPIDADRAGSEIQTR